MDDTPFTLRIGRQEMKDLLNNAASQSGVYVDAFFNNLFDSTSLMQEIQTQTPFEIRRDRLHFCLEVNQPAYQTIVKATAFYWLGMLALRTSDYETALFFMDAALSEEERNNHDLRTNPTPTTRFLLLEGDKPEQAAGLFTAYAEALVTRIIETYNSLDDRRSFPQIRIEDIRDRFLRPAIFSHPEWRTAATSFITFNLEWDARNEFHDLRPQGGTSEPFLMHLSKGCALFETLLRFKLTEKEARAKFSLTKKVNHFEAELEYRPSYRPAENFSTLANVVEHLDRAHRTTSDAIEITRELRDAILHDIGAETGLNKSQYQRLYEMVACACLHAIIKLYPSE